MRRRKLGKGRTITCSFGHKFRGKGATRTMRSVIFHFCPTCWRDRSRCEVFMREATEPVQAEADA